MDALKARLTSPGTSHSSKRFTRSCKQLLRANASLCYGDIVDTEPPLSLGEYMRRLRRGRQWNLQKVSEETGISYTHLSRIENDSTLPNAETVAKIAKALDGDLKFMLERAACLPKEILERIMSLDTVNQSGAMLRAAYLGDGESSGSDAVRTISGLARQRGVPPDESLDIAATVLALFELPAHQRAAFTAFIKSLSGESDEART